METKRTPGPWAVEVMPSGAVTVTSGQFFVAGENSTHGLNPDNAKLIAAAPELLACLQAFERISYIWLPAAASEDHEGEMQALHQARNDMLAAIAKATA